MIIIMITMLIVIINTHVEAQVGGAAPPSELDIVQFSTAIYYADEDMYVYVCIYIYICISMIL